MTFEPDIASDYQSLDGLETLTLSQGNQAPLTVNGCLRGQVRTAELQLGASVGIELTDVPFEIPGPELPGGVQPAAGDLLTDAGGNGYRIQMLTYDTLARRYRAIARPILSA